MIPDRAELAATVRAFSPEARERALAEAATLVRGIAAAHGLTAEVEHHKGYPVTVNHPAETAFAIRTARQLLGPERLVKMPRPVTGSEDFGMVAERIPSAYLMVGACPPDRDPAKAPYNHAPQAAFDDSVLGDAAALLAALAIERLDHRQAADPAR